MNVYAKFRCAALRIKKAVGIFTELIPRTRRTTRVAFWDPPNGSKKTSGRNAVIIEDGLRTAAAISRLMMCTDPG